MGIYRKQRFESIVEDLLAKEIVRSLESDKALITITGVELNEESDKLFVSVSIYPDEVVKDTLAYLKRHSPQLSWYLVKKMKVKKIPELIFRQESKIETDLAN